MAIVSRSARDFSLTATHQLPEALGPGTYDVKDPSQWRVKSSHAPFSSTSERMTHEAKELNTPGPGSYAAEASPTKPQRPKPSSTFASRTARMLGEQELSRRALLPGPGTYSADPSRSPWGAKDKQSASQQRASGSPSGKAINWIKVSTAPSIPAPQQSYGYEEGPKGELIQQKPPSVGFSGRSDLECAGPGYYHVDDGVVRPNKAKLAPFGASRVPRMGVPIAKEVLLRPGPGSYDVGGGGGGGGANAGSSSKDGGAEAEEVKPSSVFLSSTSRDKLSFSRKSDTPGPGAYNVQPKWRAAGEGPDGAGAVGVAEHLHAFGSTCKKVQQPATEQHPVPVFNPDVPGPGAYDDHRRAFANPGPPLAPTAAAAGEKDHASHGAFNSTAQRFTLSKTTEKLTPGPGYYSAADRISLNTALQKKIIGRYGVFGTTSQRFPVPKPEPQVGPGTYDPKPDTKVAETRRKDARSAVFSSTSDRTLSTVKRIDDVPPVGAYNTEHKPWGTAGAIGGGGGGKGASGATGAGPAFDKAPRFASPVRKQVDTPGPGHYETSHYKTVENDVFGPDPVIVAGQLRRLNQSGLDRSGHSKAHGSQTARWRVGSDKDKQPGPGSYDPPTSLIKKTFNITIGENWS